MKKDNINQLELPILMDLSINKSIKINESSTDNCTLKEDPRIGSSQVAGKEDNDVYVSIRNAYYKAISLRKV